MIRIPKDLSMIDENTRQRPSFFSNLISCFRISFYRDASKFPLTTGLLHVAGLSAILTAVVFWVLILPNYNHFRDTFIPTLTEFYTKAVHDGIFFEDGKVVYEDVGDYDYAAKVFESKLGIIVSTDGSVDEIPEEYAEVILFTGDKVFSGNSETKKKQDLPEERTSAREYIVSKLKANPTIMIIQGTQVFSLFFSTSALVVLIMSVIFYGLLGRKIPGLSFSGQISICCFAATPLFAGAAAIQGIAYQSIFWMIAGISLLLFAILAFLGTRELLLEDDAE